MKRSTLIVVFCIFVCSLLVAGVSQMDSHATAAPQDQQNIAQGFEYAQLKIDNQNYVFETSGMNAQPRQFSLIGLYRFLGGNQRPSLVNLLGEIGSDGWELVDVSQDRTVYVFRR